VHDFFNGSKKQVKEQRPRLVVPQPDGLDVVHAKLLRGLPELIKDLGGDPLRYARPIGLRDFRQLDSLYNSYQKVSDVLERVSADLGCPDLGMRLALRQGATGTFGPLGNAMKKAATLGEALQFAADHAYAHSPAVGIWMKRYPGEPNIKIGHTFHMDGPLIRPQMIEQIFLTGQLIAHEFTGGKARIRRMLFRHHPVSPAQVYRKYFGCSVHFGQAADIAEYHEEDLVCPMFESDPLLYRRAMVDIEANCSDDCPLLRTQVRIVINHFLNSDSCTREFVAEQLSLYPRTMDRRLNDEGTSFLQIKDEVRRYLLTYYVQRSRFDFARISEWLGFSEQSVMTRKCRKWFDVTPRQMRNASRAPAGAAVQSMTRELRRA
jgi:AraC-like DNA-binding protein